MRLTSSIQQPEMGRAAYRVRELAPAVRSRQAGSAQRRQAAALERLGAAPPACWLRFMAPAIASFKEPPIGRGRKPRSDGLIWIQNSLALSAASLAARRCCCL